MTARLATVGVVLLVALTAPIAGVGAVAAAPGDDTREIAYGETVRGAVDSVDAIRDNPTENGHVGEWYYEPVSFEGNAGDVVNVSLYGPTDTSMVLVGPDGQRLSHNEDGGSGNNSEIVTRLPADGTYTIQVTSHFPEDSYEYLLSLHRLDAEERTSIELGETVVGTVDETNPESEQFHGRYAELSLSAPAGQEIELTHSSAADSGLFLIGPNNQVVAQKVAPYAGQDVTLRYVVEQDRPYTVIVASDDYEGEFSYQVSASAVTENESANDSAAGNDTAANETDETSGGDGHSGHAPDAPASPSLRVLDGGLNQSATTLGTSVTHTVTVANFGDAAGTFDEPVLVDGTETVRYEATLAPYEMRTLSVSMTPNRTGQYAVALGDGDAQSLTVVPPANADGNTVQIGNDTYVGVAQNATAGQTVPFEFEMGTADATLQTVSVDAGGSGTLWLEAKRTANLSAGGPPADGLAVQHGFALSPSLQANGTTVDQSIQRGTVTVDVSRAALGETAEANVVLYRYDEGAGTWTALPTTRVASTAENVTYRAETDRFSTLALGTVTPVQAGGSLSTNAVSAGETVTVTATVRNDGSAPVETTVPVTVDGDTVTERTLTVQPGGEQTFTATLSPAAGTHAVGVGGTQVGTLDVAASGTADGENAMTTDATPTSTTGGDGPGFTAVVALLSVVAALLLGYGRREA
ncbi:pre-peptidase C-terminal domain-containing protein [Haloarcula nitratireducens]|uniref:PGF-pre-PGF domain-containing protein n=1 Tax=Haloarcula nitratireducens TaxID=2487749 RepID=A0AAW4P7L8_9EURY|nr:pre-peptidase C-terminal domain-containing protein [Halomicroarcula nitratireducens]MBX0294036.1 PGF-pre-PGF domain-containing protein [Halomicroarcula nitratireducens]